MEDPFLGKALLSNRREQQKSRHKILPNVTSFGNSPEKKQRK
jgi:hypothetical protein